MADRFFRHLQASEGEVFQLGRITIIFKAGPKETLGAFTLCEAIEPPDSGAGRHRHGYDEVFRILEGRYEFEIGENGQDKRMVCAGETLFVPGGTAHAFKSLGPGIGRQLIVSSPGGIFDAFIREVATAMSGNDSSPKTGVDFRAIAARHGIEFLS